MKETVMTETEVTTEATGTAETIPAGCTDNKNSMDPATSTDSKTNSIDTAGSAPNESAEALRELIRRAENIENALNRIIFCLEQPWRH